MVQAIGADDGCAFSCLFFRALHSLVLCPESLWREHHFCSVDVSPDVAGFPWSFQHLALTCPVLPHSSHLTDLNCEGEDDDDEAVMPDALDRYVAFLACSAE